MKQEHAPWDIHSFSSGADSDTNKEKLGSSDDGNYVEMQNGTDVDGDGAPTDVVRKLDGEVVVHPDNLPAGNYQCMWNGQVLDYFVEVWADVAAVAPSLIRVNGTIVLQSLLFPVTVADPCQVAKTEMTEGGEICITAKSFVPLVFNVKNMVDSLISDPNRYFSAFDPALYSVNLYQNLDTLVYSDHVNLGGGGGLPVGDYQYRMRLVTKSGDRTNFSVATQLIPVVENMSSASLQFPYCKTFGREASPTSPTRYGIKLKFRVTNFFNFDFVEILRVSWNQGAGIGFNPTAQIVGRISISPNEVSIREFTDPGDQNVDPPEAVSDAEIDQQLRYIAGAKTVRYFDRRLEFGNIQLETRIPDLTFLQIAGQEMHPVIDKLGKAGYGDIWNYVNRRHYVHGEKYGFAIQGFDGVFGQAYAQKIDNATDFQIPNRREETSATTELYSYGGTVKAANVSGTVGQTHEVFDLSDAIAKTDACSFKNIYQAGGLAGSIIAATGNKLKATVNTPDGCDNEDNGAIENHGALVGTGVFNRVYPYYHPFTPVSQNDPDTTGHNYVVNITVSKADRSIGANNSEYRPVGFAPNYYSQGLLLAGVDNIPAWMKGFSVVRTDAAGRVVAQGIGCYSMDPAEFNAVGNTKLCTKDKKKFWFFSPDIENGIVSSDVLNDIIDNPANYSVQFVSPLGFFSEVYNFENNSLNEDRNRIIDMISYVRMIRDVTGGQINPMEDVNMGINGGDGNRYVAYEKWRNTGQQPNSFSGADGGNRVFGVTSVERIVEGRGSYLSLEVDNDVYGTENVGGTVDREFEDQGMKDWTEPVYIINIIRTGAAAKDADITDYKQCHFQKIESVIGRGNGTSFQSYPLVDERWEDCIPALDSTHPTASTDRYIYIRKTNGTVQRWLNVTFYTAAQIATIINTINNTGSYLGSQGVYTHERVGPRDFNIVFNQAPFYPAVDDIILVRYDNTAPIRFWGGDGMIGESIFAPIDRQADAKRDKASTQFAMGLGFPYFSYRLNPRYYQINDTSGANRIQDEDWTNLGYLRQLCMMFTVESRGAMAYAFGRDYPLQFFPQVNYVIRPHRWDPTKSIVDQDIYENYVDDYGEVEKSQWDWGGFRFRQNINPEYSNEPQKRYFSAPEFGFEEQLDQRYMIVWSMPRQTNVQNMPGVRTFPANNAFIIDDKTGEIKYLWDAITSRGDNAYAFTEKGTVMLLTNKSILSDLDGGEIAYMASPDFVKGQYWWSRGIGISDEMWKTAAEGELPVVVDESGTEVRQDGLFFMNKESVFLFTDNNHKDIGRAKYFKKVFDAISKTLPAYGTVLTGLWNSQHQQYWLQVRNTGESPNIEKTLMYSQRKRRWIGYNQFKFDQMAMSNDLIYASRDGETYQLDSGFIMNGQNVEFFLDFASSPSPFDEKEFIRVRINSGRTEKPTRVEFYDKDMNLLCFLDQASLGPLYLKRYDGWEQFIPRKIANAQGVRQRLQDRVVIVRFIYNLATDFTAVMAGVQSKLIK